MSIIKRTIVIGDKNKVVSSIKQQEFKREPNPKGKNLVIVESPAKAKTIEKILGDNYKVLASMGHLRDLPQNALGVNIDNDFEPQYINAPNRRNVILDLQKEANKSSNIILATDPDREGEAISYHLAKILDINTTDPVRITFNEITAGAILEAIKQPRPINQNKVLAQQARRVLDRLVGYKLSPFLWKKLFRGLSAGRVQSVAVRLICEREEKINEFKPEEYWSVDSSYKINSNEHFIAKLKTEDGQEISIKNESEARKISDELLELTTVVEKVTKSQKRRKSQPPFTTSTLQQDSASKLGFGAKKTMMVAQQLYEGLDIDGENVGLITYMRTDSTRISLDVQKEAKEYIESVFGKEYVPEKPNQFAGQKKSQDAHEAIRPTSLNYSPDVVAKFIGRDQFRLYTLIWNRFLASQMSSQVSHSVAVVLTAGKYGLRAVGSTIVFDGFSVLYGAREKEELLPEMIKGDMPKILSIEPKQHFTQPPARYTEASLIKLLEEKGIGRPSTYAPILTTIINRNYVEKKEKAFVPTELGFVVVDILKRFFEKIINVKFTSDLEDWLDKIDEGKATYEKVMLGFYEIFSEELAQAEKQIDKVKIEEKESEVLCEKCNRKMIFKFGRFGKFLACPNFPECRNTKAMVDKIGTKCPLCKEGDVIRRKTKRGRIFYGCDQYPNCNLALWYEPVDQFCPDCNSIMVKKRYKNGTEKIICSDKVCLKKKKEEA